MTMREYEKVMELIGNIRGGLNDAAYYLYDKNGYIADINGSRIQIHYASDKLKELECLLQKTDIVDEPK